MGKKGQYGKAGNAADKKRRRDKEEDWKSRSGGDRKDDRNNDSKPRGNWGLSNFTHVGNERFQAYYRAQMPYLNADETDYTSFLDHLKAPLPACFRICSDFAFKGALRNQLLELAGTGITVTTSENKTEEIEPVKMLKWYPNVSIRL